MPCPSLSENFMKICSTVFCNSAKRHGLLRKSGEKSCVPGVEWNILKMFPIIPCIKSHLRWQFHENQFSRFSVLEQIKHCRHHNDDIISAMGSQITSLTIVYSTVYSGADQRKHQSSASLAFVRVIHRSPVNSPHKGPVTRMIFPFDDVTMHSFGLFSALTLLNACLRKLEWDFT